MAGTFKEALATSARDFDKVVLPILSKLYPSGKFVQVESKADDISQFFDAYAGIDLWLLDNSHKYIKGFASRIQRVPFSYDTFTVRLSRDSGTVTEYAKRVKAIKCGELYPTLTYQAYVSNDGTKLLGMAIVRTVDLFDYIKEHKPTTRHTSSYQSGQAEFYVIKWDDMCHKNYELMIIKPTNELNATHTVTWRTGKKLLVA